VPRFHFFKIKIADTNIYFRSLKNDTTQNRWGCFVPYGGVSAPYAGRRALQPTPPKQNIPTCLCWVFVKGGGFGFVVNLQAVRRTASLVPCY